MKLSVFIVQWFPIEMAYSMLSCAELLEVRYSHRTILEQEDDDPPSYHFLNGYLKETHVRALTEV